MDPAPTPDAQERDFNKRRATHAARVRWGAPKTVDLTDLNAHERWAIHRLVADLVAAKKGGTK